MTMPIKTTPREAIFVTEELNWNPAIGVTEGVSRLAKWVEENKSIFSVRRP